MIVSLWYSGTPGLLGRWERGGGKRGGGQRGGGHKGEGEKEGREGRWMDRENDGE